MSKAIVFYDTKYGYTKLVAEKIAEGIKQVGGIETEVQDVEESSPKDALDYDLILLGPPNHIGRPSRKMKKFIDKLSKLDLSDQMLQGLVVDALDCEVATCDRIAVNGEVGVD